MNKLALGIVLILLTIDVSAAMYHFMFKRRNIQSPLQQYSPYLKISFVPLMTLLWSVISPTHSKWIYLYALFAWGGDTILLSPNFDIYKFGGFSFFMSHVMMIIYLRIKWSKVPLYAYLMMIPGIALIITYLIPQMVNQSLQSFCFISYALILMTGSCNAIARLDHLTLLNPSYLCCVFGYLFYLISDSILLRREMFGADVNLDVEVMSTYFLAQIFIFLGIAIEPCEAIQKKND